MPSFNLWRGVLLEYVPPQRSVEFTAQLARLFTEFGHEWEPDPKPKHERHDTEEDKARHALIRAEIRAGWSDEERAKRSDGVVLEKRIKELANTIERMDRERNRMTTRVRAGGCQKLLEFPEAE
jgi:hypothetical protein